MEPIERKARGRVKGSGIYPELVPMTQVTREMFAKLNVIRNRRHSPWSDLIRAALQQFIDNDDGGSLSLDYIYRTDDDPGFIGFPPDEVPEPPEFPPDR